MANSEAKTQAIEAKCKIAREFNRVIEAQGWTKKALAAELKTSRAQLDRLLDENSIGISLKSIMRLAVILNIEVRITME